MSRVLTHGSRFEWAARAEAALEPEWAGSAFCGHCHCVYNWDRRSVTCRDDFNFVHCPMCGESCLALPRGHLNNHPPHTTSELPNAAGYTVIKAGLLAPIIAAIARIEGTRTATCKCGCVIEYGRDDLCPRAEAGKVSVYLRCPECGCLDVPHCIDLRGIHTPGTHKAAPPPPSPARVYLSGPITGLTWAEATGWREEADRLLALRGVVALSPLRENERLHELVGDRGLILETDDQSWAERDIKDVLNCDVLLVNLLSGMNSDIRTVSQGTILEVGLARACYLPIVVVARPWDRHLRCAIFRACVTSLHEIKEEGVMVPELVIDEVAELAKEMA